MLIHTKRLAFREIIPPDQASAKPTRTITTMKKLRKSRKVRKNLAAKRHKRALRSKAKRAHRRGTGHKDLEEQG
ncbi:MAG: hypothetical protein KDK27_03715 [Leptospiraceae bacterium]|nr:hypothetical protein [Leptospiraceae bacterium]